MEPRVPDLGSWQDAACARSGDQGPILQNSISPKNDKFSTSNFLDKFPDKKNRYKCTCVCIMGESLGI
jgi:hypothetical protein